ncbi:unnamed protein product, partial [Effrenium voratum]
QLSLSYVHVYVIIRLDILDFTQPLGGLNLAGEVRESLLQLSGKKTASQDTLNVLPAGAVNGSGDSPGLIKAETWQLT